MIPNRVPLPGSRDGSLAGSRPVTASEMAQLGVLYGPDGKVIPALKAQESFGFGPFTPFAPQLPLGTPPRVTQYPTGFNLITTPRQEDGKSLSIPALRMLVSMCPYFRVAVEIRKKKMRGRQLDFVPRDSGQSASARKTPAYLEAVRVAKAFWRYPNRIDQLRFSGWMNSALEELFICDGLVLFPWRTNGGELYALRQINPETVKVVIDELGTPIGYQQFLYGRAATDYAVTPTAFDRDELLYLSYNPRVDTLYGTSPVEEIASIVQLAIRRLIYQLSWYSQGNVPPAYLRAPEGMSTPGQLAALQEYFDNLAGDESVRHVLRIIPHGSDIEAIKPAVLFTKDEEEAMLTLIVAHLGVPRSTFIAQVNRATAETSAQEAEDSGQKPLEVWFKEWMDDVTQNPDYLGLEDIECQFAGGRVGTEESLATTRSTYVSAGIMTIDEIRADMGLDPLEAQDVATQPAGDAPGAVPDDNSRRPEDVAAAGGPGDGGAAGDAAGSGGDRGPDGGRRPADGGRDRSGEPGVARGESERAASAKAAREELAQWKRFALKPERVKRGRWADPFVTRAISPAVADSVRSVLAVAKTESDARVAFSLGIDEPAEPVGDITKLADVRYHFVMRYDDPPRDEVGRFAAADSEAALVHGMKKIIEAKAAARGARGQMIGERVARMLDAGGTA